MSIPRRRVLQTLCGAAGACEAAANAQDSDTGTEALRSVAMFHGTKLRDERLRALKPVLERRLTQLRALRDFEVDDAIGL